MWSLWIVHFHYILNQFDSHLITSVLFVKLIIFVLFAFLYDSFLKKLDYPLFTLILIISPNFCNFITFKESILNVVSLHWCYFYYYFVVLDSLSIFKWFFKKKVNLTKFYVIITWFPTHPPKFPSFNSIVHWIWYHLNVSHKLLRSTIYKTIPPRCGIVNW